MKADDDPKVTDLTVGGLLDTLNCFELTFSRLEITVGERTEAAVYATRDPQLIEKIDALVEEYEALGEKKRAAS